MPYQKTPQEQKLITRQTCSDCAADLYAADKINAGQLETISEYFVGSIYYKLGLKVGDALNETQAQEIIVLIAGKLEAKEVVDNIYLFAKYVYEGTDAKS